VRGQAQVAPTAWHLLLLDKLVDLHTKKVLFQNPKYIFREQYQISQTPSAQFEEDQPALERLARDFARTLVTEILEDF
jgi:hypothetical protein